MRLMHKYPPIQVNFNKTCKTIIIYIHNSQTSGSKFEMFANIRSGTFCRLTLKLITFTLPLRSLLFYPLTRLFDRSDFSSVVEGTLAFSVLSSCNCDISLDMPATKILVFSPMGGCFATWAAVFMITLRVLSFSHSFIRWSFYLSSC